MVIRLGTEPDPAVRRRKRRGELIRQTRKVQGVTAEELAEKVGVHLSAIYQWERGDFSPREDHQLRIAAALGVAHGAIFGLDGEMAS